MDFSTLRNNYKVSGTIAKGSSGRVMLGWDTALGTRVAIKQASFSSEDKKSTIVGYFRNEAELLRLAEHPRIIKVLDDSFSQEGALKNPSMLDSTGLSEDLSVDSSEKGLKNSKTFELKSFSNKLRCQKSLPSDLSSIIFPTSKIFPNHSTYQSPESPFIVLEHFENGDLFELLSQASAFSENLTRFFFQQALEAVTHLHSLGFAHRDLKLENFVIDDNFSLKMIDLAFGSSLKEETKTIKGTRGYFAPEMLSGLPFNLEKSDIFALGVMLILMATGTQPFEQAVPSNQHFRTFVENKRLFWSQLREESPRNGPTTAEFRNLAEGLLEPNPKERFSLVKAREHEWTKRNVDCPAARAEVKKILALKKMKEWGGHARAVATVPCF